MSILNLLTLALRVMLVTPFGISKQTFPIKPLRFTTNYTVPQVSQCETVFSARQCVIARVCKMHSGTHHQRKKTIKFLNRDKVNYLDRTRHLSYPFLISSLLVPVSCSYDEFASFVIDYLLRRRDEQPTM